MYFNYRENQEKLLIKQIKTFLKLVVIIFFLRTENVEAADIKLPFTDVKENWAYTSILECYQNGWIKGTTPTTFSPKDNITRAQFVTILGRYANADVEDYTTSKFEDINFSSWGYAPYVAWAEEKGVAHGINDKQFNPTGNVTRAQLAVFFHNYVKYLGVELKEVKPNIEFSDYKTIPTYARESVMNLAKAGVVSGSKGKFDPNTDCSREMCASFLVKFNKALSEATYPPDEPKIEEIFSNSAGNVILTWGKIEDAMGYRIYRKENKGTKWEIIESYYKNSTTYVDETVEAGKRYMYCIRSYNYTENKNRLWSTYGNYVKEIVVENAIYVNPESPTFDNIWENSSYYNEFTKNYYMIKSYLDELEKQGGGTLILEAGIYNIPYTLCIPSNVALRLSDGVVINKTEEVGNSPAKSSKVLFSFVDGKASSVNNSAKAYEGVKNSVISGEGTAIINSSLAGNTMFLLGHNSNISLSNLRVNVNDASSYAIKIYGSEKISINNCIIQSTASAMSGILLEPAGGSNISKPAKWCALDNTNNREISIKGCQVIGTTYGIFNKYYIGEDYQQELSIKENRFENIAQEAIRGFNWSNSIIENNIFYNISGGANNSGYSSVHLFASQNPVIKDNSFDKVNYTITIAYNYSDNTNSNVSQAAIDEMLNTNQIGELYKYYISITQYGKESQLYYFPDDTQIFYITETSTPYRNRYTDFAEEERFYFNLRAAFDQIEINGRGTVVVQTGDYKLSGVIYIPSNSNLIFEDGVNVKKSDDLYVMFAFANRQDILNGTTYSEYNGVHDIRITASDGAQVELDNNYQVGNVFEIGHVRNLTISDLKMKNMHGDYHFIELDASDNVTINNCTFEGTTDTGVTKEAINLDVPDPNTGGFGGVYSSQDKTANKNIFIQNNIFDNIPVAIGTHMYTEKAAHTNVNILNNTIKNCFYHGISVMNWDSPIIKGNEFENIGKMQNGENNITDTGTALKIRGIKNPTITKNIITNAMIFARISIANYTFVDNENLLKYEWIYNDISEQNKSDLLDNTYNNVTYPLIYYRNTSDGAYETWYKTDYSAKEFTITPDSTPYLGQYMDYDTYNEDTRLYYTIKSYLEHFEKIGEGILTFSKGNYSISNTLYVPSNTKIVLEENAIIQNRTKNGMIFVVRNPGDELSSVEDYKSASNVAITGKGVIDTLGDTTCQPIFLAKNDTVTISGITFTGNCGNYIRVFSSKNIVIENCTFIGDGSTNAIYINNSYNDAVCKNVEIRNSKFEGNQYSIITNSKKGYYHEHISVVNNQFEGGFKDFINGTQWKNSVISKNTFKNNSNNDYYGFRLTGIIELIVSENTFENMVRCGTILFDSNYGENILNDELKEIMKTQNNYGENVKYPCVFFRKDSNSSTEYLYDVNHIGTNFTITKDSEPFMGVYKTYDTYNEHTKDYYVLKSYMELSAQIADTCTITLEEGIYNISNTIYIPSNTILEIKSNAVVRKSDITGTEELSPSKTLFILAEDSASYNAIKDDPEYSGASNISIVGGGTIDCGGNSCHVVTMPRNVDVFIDEINFVGLNTKEFYIRIWSSKDVVLQNCTMTGNDALNGYGVSISSYYEDSPCNNIDIKDTIFTKLDYSIYGSNLSGNIYQKNIDIENCTFKDNMSYSIYGTGWENCTIKGNRFNNIQKDINYTINLYGIINPTITENTFLGVKQGVLMSVKDKWTSNIVSESCKNIIMQTNNFGEEILIPVIYRQDINSGAIKW